MGLPRASAAGADDAAVSFASVVGVPVFIEGNTVGIPEAHSTSRAAAVAFISWSAWLALLLGELIDAPFAAV